MFKSLESVAPTPTPPPTPHVLHLSLGIVLKLYKVLVSELQGLDEKETKTTRTKDQKAIGKLWKAASIKLQEKEQELSSSGSEHLELRNLADRFLHALSGNQGGVDTIAMHENDSKATRQNNDNCDSLCCAISDFDFDVNWLKCAFCNKWVHSICEGMTGAEFLKLSKNRKSYRCLRCQGREREEIGSLIEEKFSQLEERQEIIEGKILELEKECVGYQDQLKDEMGPTENDY